MKKGPKGEASFETGKQKVVKFENKPMPVKVYEAKGLGVVEIKKAAGAGKLPYVDERYELLNTATKKGGKNRTLNHRFFLQCSPTDTGFVMVNRGDGVTALVQSAGIKAKLPAIPATKVDEEGKKASVRILDPEAVKKLLTKMAGRVISIKIKNEKDQNNPDQSWPRVDFFGPATGADGDDADEDEEEIEEDEEETDDDEESAEDEEDEDSEDESDEDEEDGDDDEDEDEDDEDEDDESDDDDEDEDGDEDDDDSDEDEDVDEEDEDEDEPAPKKKRGRPAKKGAKKGKK